MRHFHVEKATIKISIHINTVFQLLYKRTNRNIEREKKKQQNRN